MNTHDSGRLFGWDGQTMWTEPTLDIVPMGDYQAHCGRWDLHGLHADPVFCVGNKGERIVASE